MFSLGCFLGHFRHTEKHEDRQKREEEPGVAICIILIVILLITLFEHIALSLGTQKSMFVEQSSSHRKNQKERIMPFSITGTQTDKKGKL